MARWLVFLLPLTLIVPMSAQMRTIQTARGGASISFANPALRSVACVTSAGDDTELVDNSGAKFTRLEDHQFFIGRLEGRSVSLRTASRLPMVTVCQEVEPSSGGVLVVLRDMHRLLQALYSEYIERGRK